MSGLPLLTLIRPDGIALIGGCGAGVSATFVTGLPLPNSPNRPDDIAQDHAASLHTAS